MIIPTPNKNPITSCYVNNDNDNEYIPYQSTLDNVILKNIQHPFFNIIADSSGNEWEKYMYKFHNANVSYHVWDIINKQGTSYDKKQNKKRWESLNKNLKTKKSENILRVYLNDIFNNIKIIIIIIIIQN